MYQECLIQEIRDKERKKRKKQTCGNYHTPVMKEQLTTAQNIPKIGNT